jgi:hypothetical protein
MSAIMVIEIVVGIVILAVVVRFAVRETRRLNAATEADNEAVDTPPVPERSESQAQPAAELNEQEAEQLNEVSATETK